VPEPVHRQDRAGAAILTLDSPENRNALSKGLVLELQTHLDAARDDGRVRAVVLTGTGRTFCAGADLSDPPVESGPGSYGEVLRTLWEYPKPVVTSVNGHVRAGGLGLVAAADVVLCAASASFAFTEVRIGVSPAIISVLCLRRMTPIAASRYLLTGERFDPEAAAQAGLVTAVVADSGLEAAVDSVVAELGQCEPHALEVTRALIRQVPAMTVEHGFEHTQRVSQELFASAAAAEGIAAFREKRPPRWAG
jgi:methylglutaconyl-CoA hydratase